MYHYEMDPTRTVGAVERIRDVDGWTDRRTDGLSERSGHTQPILKWDVISNSVALASGYPPGGGRLNIKMPFYQYMDSYVNNKIVSWLSYL